MSSVHTPGQPAPKLPVPLLEWGASAPEGHADKALGILPIEPAHAPTQVRFLRFK
ncbi:MAG: hypothetical protein MRJ96_16980 [Nitrospirales bacterium]|nr:hypothetical protein [Nitrospira sp.]MDR4503140.1 hypothetical protein [Nitrospirales bacterium]